MLNAAAVNGGTTAGIPHQTETRLTVTAKRKEKRVTQTLKPGLCLVQNVKNMCH